MEQIINLLTWAAQYGVPAVLLILLILGIGYGSMRMAVWLGANILLPMRDRHFQFYESVEKALEGMRASIDKQGEVVGQILNRVQK